MSPTSFNDIDPAGDAAFPRIFPFDPDASPPPEPPTEPAPEPPPVDDGGPPAPAPDVPDVPDDAEVDPAELLVDESQLDDEELLEADAFEPEQITDIEIGVD